MRASMIFAFCRTAAICNYFLFRNRTSFNKMLLVGMMGTNSDEYFVYKIGACCFSGRPSTSQQPRRPQRTNTHTPHIYIYSHPLPHTFGRYARKCYNSIYLTVFMQDKLRVERRQTILIHCLHQNRTKRQFVGANRERLLCCGLNRKLSIMK